MVSIKEGLLSFLPPAYASGIGFASSEAVGSALPPPQLAIFYLFFRIFFAHARALYSSASRATEGDKNRKKNGLPR